MFKDAIYVEKHYNKIYLTYKEIYKELDFKELETYAFKEEFINWTIENDIKVKVVNLIYPMSELKLFRIEIPKLKNDLKQARIKNILEKNKIYDESRYNVNIINYSYPDVEKLIFVLIEKEKIERIEKSLTEIGYKLGNLDADFNRVPFIVPLVAGIKVYMYISYGKNYVGVTIYDEAEIVYIKNIKIDEDWYEKSKIEDIVPIIKNTIEEFLEKMNYEIDLVVVKNSFIKNEIMGEFEMKTMGLDELIHI